MKSRFWNVFRVIVGISSLPLTFLMIFFSGSKQFGWVSNLSLVILFSFGLIGGVCGFIIYGIKRQPGPLSNYLRPRQPLSAYKRNLLVFFLLLSCLATACFVYGIRFLINGGGDIHVNTGVSFLIPKPGEYTLWASSENLNETSVPTLANELQIIPDQITKSCKKNLCSGRLFIEQETKSF